jgi:hypothetical protein
MIDALNADDVFVVVVLLLETYQLDEIFLAEEVFFFVRGVGERWGMGVRRAFGSCHGYKYNGWLFVRVYCSSGGCSD